MAPFKPMATVIVLALLMSACSPLEKAVNPYHEDFHCRASEDGGKCIDTPSAYNEARYPQVNAAGILVDETGLPISEATSADQKYQMVSGLLEQPKKPILQPPKILRVLLLPYEGEGSELFMSRYVYLKVENSDWILSDINETAK